MKLYPNSKVYIFCPGNVHTGGPELCHQLCSQLIQFGVETYIVYYPFDNFFNPEDPVHEAFKKYHVPHTSHIEESLKNIAVLPEVWTHEIYKLKKIRHVIWWMSVDNYLERITITVNQCLKNPLENPLSKAFFFHEADNDIDHFVQSEYARQFLKLNGASDDKVYVVEDYVSQVFLNRALKIDLSAKKNFVVYNSKKGLEITRQLMKIAPKIDWRPIKDMTPEQVQELLASAKVYIDFGKHPGKDRIPREAAISDCVVITGKRGAAANDIDVNIPDEFKFDERTVNLHLIIKKIREAFENFGAAHEKQADYRARILNDKARFTHEVAEAFGIKKFPPPTVAIVQGVDEKSFLLTQELFKSKDFVPGFIVDDVLASAEIFDEFILREQKRNYLRVGKNFVEIITQDDAKFLYLEGRIKKFAMFEPTDAELDEFKNFYKPNYEDVLIISR